MPRDYPSYNWSIATLDTWLRLLIYFIFDNETSVDTVTEAVKKEIVGRGKFLGYRLLAQKLRNEHQIKVPKHLVLNVMRDVDPEGIENRSVKKN